MNRPHWSLYMLICSTQIWPLTPQPLTYEERMFTANYLYSRTRAEGLSHSTMSALCPTRSETAACVQRDLYGDFLPASHEVKPRPLKPDPSKTLSSVTGGGRRYRPVHFINSRFFCSSFLFLQVWHAFKLFYWNKKSNVKYMLWRAAVRTWGLQRAKAARCSRKIDRAYSIAVCVCVCFVCMCVCVCVWRRGADYKPQRDCVKSRKRQRVCYDAILSVSSDQSHGATDMEHIPGTMSPLSDTHTHTHTHTHTDRQTQ